MSSTPNGDFVDANFANFPARPELVFECDLERDLILGFCLTKMRIHEKWPNCFGITANYEKKKFRKLRNSTTRN